MRTNFVDVMRGIGICLVVIGHLGNTTSSVINFLYVFHVPLFFFISGFLQTNKNFYSIDFHTFAGNLIFHLLIPYMAFSLFSYLIFIMKPLNYFDVGNFLSSILVGNVYSLYFNQVLWFFPCLICAKLFFWTGCKLLGVKASSLFFLFLGILIVSLNELFDFKNIFSISSSIVALVFFIGGVLVRGRKDYLEIILKENTFFYMILLSIVIVVSIYNGRVDLAGLEFGSWPFYFLGAFSGVILTLKVSNFLSGSKFLSYLGQSTIYIFPLHPLFF